MRWAIGGSNGMYPVCHQELLNIVIPVYNEAANIENTFSQIAQHVRTRHRILVVYDFPEDNTVPVVQRWMARYDHIHLIENRHGGGALAAIKTGFASVDSGVVLVIMADLSDSLDQIDRMYLKICQGYDVVCGSRYMHGGRQIGGPRLKKMLSRLAGVSLHYLTGVPTHDITNSFKMYRKTLLDAIVIESDGGFELGMEIVVKAFVNGYRITQVPTVWRDRASGESRFRLRQWLPKYLYWYAFALRKSFYK